MFGVRLFRFFDALWIRGCALLMLAGMQSACQTPVVAGKNLGLDELKKNTPQAMISIPSPEVWGGEVRCDSGACRWVAVEHETSQVVLYALQGRQARLLDRRSVAYHPDSAKWIDNSHVVAAVEKSQTLDIFSVSSEGKLNPKAQIDVGFEPRDVAVLPARDGGWLLLATPYRGEQVAWVYWHPAKSPRKALQTWCAAPWHVTRVPKGPKGQGPGLTVGCLDDKQLLYVPEPHTFEEAVASPVTSVRMFDHVPRRVGVTPSGRYWYVALELGGSVARYDVVANIWQTLPFTVFGAVGVAAYDDDTVAWGENNQILLVRYDKEGGVVVQRRFPVSGFPTELQWIDVDQDGVIDLISMNSAGPASDILYGPLLP
ncbi:hypothetical protein Tfont_02205 [Tepidimonas fonticaldi]|uniref:Repeat domain in Vibrio, Colwellia, Bradyrhizobium and Shewanella n=1 Tax=Tepidimonas fonticaldi TaxID=1101373 RepID=A0A554XIM1_9BURK|nr:hypothetical protein [Tepidimonas fonticaldi]TSE35694.1 hypothetical protein Tfont_02205 [Tepidimonas fonticaldi]